MNDNHILANLSKTSLLIKDKSHEAFLKRLYLFLLKNTNYIKSFSKVKEPYTALDAVVQFKSIKKTAETMYSSKIKLIESYFTEYAALTPDVAEEFDKKDITHITADDFAGLPEEGILLVPREIVHSTIGKSADDIIEYYTKIDPLEYKNIREYLNATEVIILRSIVLVETRAYEQIEQSKWTDNLKDLLN